MTLVFARNHQEAKIWAERHHLHPREWIYIDSPETCKGMRGCSVAYVGTWVRREDQAEIMQAIRKWVCT